MTAVAKRSIPVITPKASAMLSVVSSPDVLFVKLLVGVLDGSVQLDVFDNRKLATMVDNGPFAKYIAHV